MVINNDIIVCFGCHLQQLTIGAGKNQSWSITLPLSFKSNYVICATLQGQSMQPFGVYRTSINNKSNQTLTGFNITCANRNNENSAIVYGVQFYCIGF